MKRFRCLWLKTNFLLARLCCIAVALACTLAAAADNNLTAQQGLKLEASGDYAQAIATLESVDLDDVRLSTRTAVWLSLSRCYAATGSYDKSTEYLRRLLPIVSERKSRDAIWLNISDNLWYLGNYAEMTCCLDSVANQSQTVSRRVNALVGQKDYESAEKLLQQLLNQDLPDDEKAIAMQNLGYVEWAQENYDEAVSWLEKALANLPPTSDNYATALANIGYIRGCGGDYDNGISQIAEAERLQRTALTSTHPDLLISLRKKAEIEVYAQRISDASKTFREYFKGERSNLINTIGRLSTNNKLSLWAKEKPLLSKCFLLEDNDAEFLFEVAMFRRQTSLAGMHDTSQLKTLLNVSTTQVRTALKTGEVAIEFVSYEPTRNHTAYAAIILPKVGKARFVRIMDESDIYSANTVNGISLYEAIRQKQQKDINTLYNDSVWGNKIWGNIMAALPASAKKIYFAPEGIFHLLGIENMTFDGKDGREFHRVTSIAAWACGSHGAAQAASTKALLVGGLHYDETPADSTATESTSDRDAANLLRTQLKSVYFGDLKCTKSEVDSINGIMKGSEAHFTIMESNLKTIMPQFRVVHIATHGYALDFGIRKQPEYLADSIPYDKSLIASGLAMSGVNRAIAGTVGDDQILSAREICDLDLSKVEFVVLSACETARGSVTDEGAAGLVRGLKNAGVKTILATLWQVDDRSTMLFMQEFYRKLSAGASRYKAFAAAQQFLRDYRKVYYHQTFSSKKLARDSTPQKYEITYKAPYYWAPFILIDD